MQNANLFCQSHHLILYEDIGRMPLQQTRPEKIRLPDFTMEQSNDKKSLLFAP
jgi:hypothetical protein